MANVTIENNGELFNSADFFSDLWSAFNNTTYADRLSAVLNGLRIFDINATTDFQSGGALTSYTNGQTTTVNLDRYQVEMTGTLSASGSRLSLYKITDFLNGDVFILSGDLQYNYYPLYPGTQLLPGSKITGFTIVSGNAIGFAECDAILQSDYKTLTGTLSSATSFTMATAFTDGGTTPFYGLVAENSITFSFDLNTGATSFSGTTNSQMGGIATTSLEEIRNTGTFTWSDYIKIDGMSLGVNSPPTTDVFASSDNVSMSGSFGSTFFSGGGNDTITGSVNNDTFVGGAGNDSIIGGDGIDTVVFSGARANYTIAKSGSEYIFTDLVLNRDGVDRLNNVELVKFSDGENFLNDQYVNATSITRVFGPGFYQTAKGNTVAAEFGYLVGDVIDTYDILLNSALKNYIPKAANLFLIRYDNGDKGIISSTLGKYKEQKFNANGIATGLPQKLTIDQMFAKELEGNVDLNNDGYIGNVVREVIDNDGDLSPNNFGIYKLSSGKYVVAEAEATIGELLVSDTVLMKTSLKAWKVPVGGTIIAAAEKPSGDIEILLNVGTATRIQVFDQDTGLLIGKAVLKADDIAAREYYYNFDLNTDLQVILIGQESPPLGW